MLNSKITETFNIVMFSAIEYCIKTILQHDIVIDFVSTIERI